VRLVLGRDKEVSVWAEGFFKKPLGKMSRMFTGPYTTIGVENNAGELTGALIFTNFDDHDVNMTVAGRGTCCRSVMRAACNYVFEQLGCSRLSVTTRADNYRLIDQAERLGFVREGYLRRLYGDADGVLLGLLQKDFTL
jgi:hypothetical protein